LIGSAADFWAVRNIDASDVQMPEAVIDQPFVVDVEVRCAPYADHGR